MNVILELDFMYLRSFICGDYSRDMQVRVCGHGLYSLGYTLEYTPEYN